MMLGEEVVGGALKLVDDIFRQLFPDPKDEAAAKAVILKAQADAAIAQIQQQMSVMLEEARSPDPWTSRARPSFLYVIYVLVLAAIPMGIISAISPEIGHRIITGMKDWLAAIPDNLWEAFWICFLGYTGSRSFEKIKNVAK